MAVAHRSCAGFLLLTMTLIGPEAAAQSRFAAASVPSSSVLTAPAPPRHGTPSDLNFELMPAPPPPAQGAVLARTDQQVSARRSLLLAHQLLGIATVATMAGAVVLGQLDYIDRFGGGSGTGKFLTPHAIFAYTSVGLFATSGTLAFLAPNPYPKPSRLDAVLVHKIAMVAATCGIVAQAILGPIALSQKGTPAEADIVKAHLAVGYATFGFTSVGALSFVF